jgi:hypothetical protein
LSSIRVRYTCSAFFTLGEPEDELTDRFIGNTPSVF